MVGRAVDEAGAPAGRRSLRVTCSSEGRVNGAAGRTDADGRFRVPVGDMLVGEESIVSLVADARDGGEPLAAELPARTIAAGDNDLGAVTLEAPRLLVAGRLVVRGPGDPQRVEVQVDRWDGQSYAQEFNLRPRIEADGRFELRGAMPDGTRLRLKVRSEAFLPVEAIECLVGTSDLEIELQTGGEVTASFVVDDEALARRLVYRLREVGAEPRPVDPFTEMMERLGGRRLELGADGGLHQTWAGLAPGTYRLSVLAPGVDAPLLTVDDLLVGDGPCTDPRLAAIDLRGLARNVHVAATAADGQRIADREAFVVVHGAGGASQGFHLGEGEAALVIGTSADLWVVAPGHRVAVRRAVTEDLEVPLEAAPEVRLRVGTGVRLPEGAELLAQLEPEFEGSVFLDTGRGMGLANFLSESARVDGDGLARLRPRWGGGMRVTVAIRLGQRSSIVQAVEPRRLDTLQLEPGQVSTLQIDDGALERALDRLR
jgi:hypothetical protein